MITVRPHDCNAAHLEVRTLVEHYRDNVDERITVNIVIRPPAAKSLAPRIRHSYPTFARNFEAAYSVAVNERLVMHEEVVRPLNGIVKIIVFVSDGIGVMRGNFALNERRAFVDTEFHAAFHHDMSCDETTVFQNHFSAALARRFVNGALNRFGIVIVKVAFRAEIFRVISFARDFHPIRIFNRDGLFIHKRHGEIVADNILFLRRRNLEQSDFSRFAQRLYFYARKPLACRRNEALYRNDRRFYSAFFKPERNAFFREFLLFVRQNVKPEIFASAEVFGGYSQAVLYRNNGV